MEGPWQRAGPGRWPGPGRSAQEEGPTEGRRASRVSHPRPDGDGRPPTLSRWNRASEIVPGWLGSAPPPPRLKRATHPASPDAQAPARRFYNRKRRSWHHSRRLGPGLPGPAGPARHANAGPCLWRRTPATSWAGGRLPHPSPPAGSKPSRPLTPRSSLRPNLGAGPRKSRLLGPFCSPWGRSQSWGWESGSLSGHPLSLVLVGLGSSERVNKRLTVWAACESGLGEEAGTGQPV